MSAERAILLFYRTVRPRPLVSKIFSPDRAPIMSCKWRDVSQQPRLKHTVHALDSWMSGTYAIVNESLVVG